MRVGIQFSQHHFFFFFFNFWPHCTACGISVPRPGIEPMPPAVEARSLNHWTTREVLPAPFVEETVLCPVWGLGTFAEDHVPMYSRIYFWALYFVPLFYVSVFMLAPHYLDCCCFVIYIEIRKCEVSNFVLFQSYFG